MPDEGYRSIDKFTGKDVRAAEVTGVSFPQLLEPVDDLPPATMVTSIRKTKRKLFIRGLSHDNGEIASVTVNGHRAILHPGQAGLADWEITLDPQISKISAQAMDRSGNSEKAIHSIRLD